MANTQYQIYLTSVLSLCRSMLVKSEAVAQAINQDLSSGASGLRSTLYTVDGADPTTWKYYLNLSGQYHESDQPMTVVSQDTLQTIPFTVDNLAVHVATAKAYQDGSRYFDDLVHRYPEQELLIRGILHPTPMLSLLSAEDGSVLWYDDTLVESNEMSLITNIEAWVKRYQRRWFNGGFVNVDDLYMAADVANMYALLPAVVLSLRLQYSRTYEAHSFHIREYLAAQGGLDRYVDYLTKAQQLWLYRNIRYIQRNPGKQSTFESLVNHILVPRGIPLSDWTMRHDTTDLQANLSPDPLFVRGTPIGGGIEIGAQSRTTEQMLAAESDVAPGNSDQTTWPSIDNALALSMNNRLPTKVLESSVVDMSDATPYTLANCLLNHWLAFASQGKYLSIVHVENPTTGETYSLRADDAFVAFVYAFNRSHGITLATIPHFFAQKVRKPLMPLQPEIASLFGEALDPEDYAALYVDMPVILRNYLSIESFADAVNAIHRSELFAHALFSTQGHLWKRAFLEQATLYFYYDTPADIAYGQSYSDWFAQKGLDIEGMFDPDLGILAASILKEATGQDLATVIRLADLQAAMLGIMGTLSSYSVQYLASINTSPIAVMELNSIRMGDKTVSGAWQDTVELPMSELMDEQGGGGAYYKDLFDFDIDIYRLGASASVTTPVDPTVHMSNTLETTATDRLMIPLSTIQGFSDNIDYSAVHMPVLDSPYYPGLPTTM